MRSMQQNPGYALVLAVLMTGLITMLVTSVVNRVMVFNRLSRALMDREQARMLALSGLQIAIAQLTGEPQPPPTKQANDKQPSELSHMLKKVEPIINRWQKFTFSDDKEGVEGSCHLYIACEQGKININRLYDFEQKRFVKTAQLDGLKIVQTAFEKLPKGKGTVEQVATFLKERGRPLQDITELLRDKKLQVFASELFPNEEQPVTLLDLCTVATGTLLLNPWFLSKSLNTVLGFKNQDKVDRTTLDTLVDQTKSVAGNVAWEQKWDTYLAPLYGKQYSTIVQEFRTLFNPEFEIPTFSVVSYGKFGNVMVKVYALVQKIEDTTISYCIKKLYWV